MFGFVNWNFNPDLISSPITIRWYGLMFAIGFIIGYQIVSRMFRHEGMPSRWLDLLLLWMVGGTIIGARLGHVFFYEWEYYSQHPIEILYIWNGGLASHGGTIALIIAMLLFSWITVKRNPIWICDRVIVPIALVSGLIRLGNLANSEIFGHATSLPWGFKFLRSNEWIRDFAPNACHPTQIYEALCYFAIFALLMWMYWRRNAGERKGLLTGTGLFLIFTSRFFIEFVKNVQVDFERDMTLDMGQWLSIPFMIIGAALIVYAFASKPFEISYPDKFPDKPDKKS